MEACRAAYTGVTPACGGMYYVGLRCIYRGQSSQNLSSIDEDPDGKYLVSKRGCLYLSVNERDDFVL